MATKRRRLGPRSIRALTPRTRGFLRTGAYLLLGPDPRPGDFHDDDEACEAWSLHRDAILDEWDRPGRRPWALWRFDLGLEPEGPRFRWPSPHQSEDELVHAMVEQGELEPCRRNGTTQIASELVQIEDDWVHWLDVCRRHYPGNPAGAALEHYGVPRWFSERRLR